MWIAHKRLFIVMLIATFYKVTNGVLAHRASSISAALNRNRYATAYSITALRDISSQTGFESDAAKVASLSYVKGQPIKVSILKFGPLGASVMIDNNDDVRGLVLQREIAMFRGKRDGVDVLIGEVVDGFVERLREDGRIDVCLRPVGRDRVSTVKQMILDSLEGSPTESIPIGDKSTPESISSYLHGISKTDFKTAIGALYRDGLVKPGALETSLMPDEEREKSRLIAKKAAEGKKKQQETLGLGLGLKPPRLASDRDNSKTIFIGNLPFKVTKEQVLKAITPILSKDVITDVRLSLNEAGQPRGFGYVDLTEESLVEVAIEKLKTAEVGGRKVRTDYADPSRSKRGNAATATTAASSFDTPSSNAAGSFRDSGRSAAGGGTGAASYEQGKGRGGSWRRVADPTADTDTGAYDRHDGSSSPIRRQSSSQPPAQWRRTAPEDEEGSQHGHSDRVGDRSAPPTRSGGQRSSSSQQQQQGKGWVRDAERTLEQAARRRSGSSSSSSGGGGGGNSRDSTGSRDRR